jgi:hypothetical protein
MKLKNVCCDFAAGVTERFAVVLHAMIHDLGLLQFAKDA